MNSILKGTREVENMLKISELFLIGAIRRRYAERLFYNPECYMYSALFFQNCVDFLDPGFHLFNVLFRRFVLHLQSNSHIRPSRFMKRESAVFFSSSICSIQQKTFCPAIAASA